MNLHEICQECKAENEKCSCGQPISLEYCKIIEQLLSVEGLKFNCKNAKKGCKEVFDKNALGEHESECIYRPVPCPYDALTEDDMCYDMVYFHEVIEHYVKEHLEESTDEYPKELNYLTLSWIETCTMSSFGKNSFFEPFECCFDPEHRTIDEDHEFLFMAKTVDKLVYRWVYILGSPMEAKKFSYTLKLFWKKGENLKEGIFFIGKVAAIDESFDTLLEAGKCFVIPREAFMAQYVDEDNLHSYSLEIHYLKEEVKDEHCESGISVNDEDTKE